MWRCCTAYDITSFVYVTLRTNMQNPHLAWKTNNCWSCVVCVQCTVRMRVTVFTRFFYFFYGKKNLRCMSMSDVDGVVPITQQPNRFFRLRCLHISWCDNGGREVASSRSAELAASFSRRNVTKIQHWSKNLSKNLLFCPVSLILNRSDLHCAAVAIF